MYLAHLVERKTDNFDVIGSIPIVYFFSPCQFSLNFNLTLINLEVKSIV